MVQFKLYYRRCWQAEGLVVHCSRCCFFTQSVMLITNFVAGGRDLYVLWDGSRNVAGWERLADVPGQYADLARGARRVAVTVAQWDGLAKEVLSRG
jgi:hypothetical protein